MILKIFYSPWVARVLDPGQGSRDTDKKKPHPSGAYMQIPLKIEDFKYVCFKWLGATFTNLKLVFGLFSAPAKFDSVNRILVELAISKSGIEMSYFTLHSRFSFELISNISIYF